MVPLPILGFEMKGFWASGGFGFGGLDGENWGLEMHGVGGKKFCVIGCRSE